MLSVILKYVCNAVIGICAGSIIDFIAGTGYICAGIGLVAGIAITVFLKSK